MTTGCPATTKAFLHVTRPLQSRFCVIVPPTDGSLWLALAFANTAVEVVVVRVVCRLVTLVCNVVISVEAVVSTVFEPTVREPVIFPPLFGKALLAVVVTAETLVCRVVTSETIVEALVKTALPPTFNEVENVP